MVLQEEGLFKKVGEEILGGLKKLGGGKSL
jgi:hypothetical protein